MSKSKVQNVGRIYYIDPNNVYNDIPNGIPHPYEDYCISVDLTICFGDRNSCGIWGNGSGDKVWTYNSDRGTINFIGGTNGYLTTNFTDIESTNPEVNTNECLGIESINITYNSWYVPQVSIRFVDVRGASLMSKQEQGYVDTLRQDMATGHVGNTQINGGSFFKALFSFPYPVFKLKVKGFYGREVTYNLAVEDFQGAFNAENGNFEVDVKFIGYMFGVYTDIPMNYLMISPYFNDESGKKYWESQKSNGRFRYYNAIPFKTYPELVRDIAQIEVRPVTTDGNGVNLDDKKRNLENRINALSSIKTELITFLSVPFDGGFAFGRMNYSKPQDNRTHDVFLFGISTKYKFLSFSGQSSSTVYNAKDGYERLLNKIKTFNDKYPNETLDVNLKHFGLFSNEGDSEEVVVKHGGVVDKYKGISGQYFFNGGSDKKTVHDWVEEQVKSKGYVKGKKLRVHVPAMEHHSRMGQTVPDWLYEIDERIEKAQNDLKEVQSEIQNHMSESISQALGFGVSVGNAFRMSFAHMETFMNIFNEYLRRIHNRKGGNTRTLNTLGVSLSNTDLPSSFKTSTSVPPFTMFYKDVENDRNGNSSTNERSGKKRVPMWPGELPGNTNGLDEIEFVNKLIDAARYYTNEMDEAIQLAEEAKKTEAEATTSTQSYIATTIYDLTHGGQKNPYEYLANVPNGNQMWEAMMLTFYLRLLAWNSSGYNKWSEDKDALKAFGSIEAYNIFLAYPTPLPGIKEFLRDRKNSSKTDFRNEMSVYLTGDSTENNRKLYDKGYGFNKHFAVVSSNALVYDWAKGPYYEKDTEGNRVSKGRNVPVFPVYNEDPSRITTDSLGSTNSKLIYLNDPTVTDCDENKHNVDTVTMIESPVTPDGKNLLYKTRYLGVINNSDTMSKYKADYEKKVLPDLSLPEYVVGFGNHAKQRDNDCAVVVVSSTNIFTRNWGGSGVKFPKKESATENDKDFYVQSPGYIKEWNGNAFAYYQLYGHPFFYEQNEIQDAKKRNYAKAFLFATSMPVSVDKNFNSEVKPFILALSQGAYFFKAKYEFEHKESLLKYGEGAYMTSYGYAPSTYNVSKRFGVNDTTFTLSRKSSSTFYGEQMFDDNKMLVDIDQSLVDLFTEWADEVFPSLNDIFELKKDGARDYKGFKKLIDDVYANSKKKKKVKAKFSEVFNGGGAYNTDFYDPNADLFVKNATAFDFQSNKVSSFQEKIIEHICSLAIMFDTSKLKEEIQKPRITGPGYATATDAFFDMLCKVYGDQTDTPNQQPDPDTGIQYDPAQDNDLKLSTYMTLKTLYDRWICMNKEERRWKLDAGPQSEFSQFRFIDGFYRKIEQRVAVNFEQIGELAREMMASSNVTNDATSAKYQGRSFYDFLASVCQKNQMMLLSLPMENEFTNPEGIEEMFDVKSYSKMDTRDTSCFVCLYSNKPSEHLEIEYDNDEYMYSSDGFNIANSRGEILETDINMMPQLSDVDFDGYRIPAFGVSYGKQNQSIFKKVTVNMQNPQVTEASIAATQFIASKGNEGGYKTALYGQDLYRIYSNYSYTCSVDMMGNAQIMPLTYFQLNNIPLFRGAYMIINIEHNIAAGEMTTKFTGVRMSRYDTPLVSDRGIFTDPFIQTNYHENAVTHEAGSTGGDVTDDAVRAASQQVVPGEHKYTVTIGDLIWSENRNTYNNKHPDDPLPYLPNEGDELACLQKLQGILQGVEDAWTNYCAMSKGEPFAEYDGIYISSGFRCGRTNRAGVSVNSLAGSKAKPHQLGHAADILICKYDTTKADDQTPRANRHNGYPYVSNQLTEKYFFKFLWKYLCENNMKWGQIIEEGKANSRWVHFAYCNDDGKSQTCQVMRYRDGSYYDKVKGCEGIDTY